MCANTRLHPCTHAPLAPHKHARAEICNTYCFSTGNNGLMNAPQCYVIRTLPVLFSVIPRFTSACKKLWLVDLALNKSVLYRFIPGLFSKQTRDIEYNFTILTADVTVTEQRPRLFLLHLLKHVIWTFRFLTATATKMSVLWNVTPCSLVLN
jgi:hypothetical protein